MKKFIILIVFLFFGFGLPIGRAEEVPRLESFLDRDVVTVGDLIRYTLKVVAEKPVEVIFPLYDDGMIGDFEIGEAGGGERKGENEKIWERRYLLQGFETGDFTLPGAEVTLRFPDGEEEKLQSPPLGITVKSLLEPSKAEADIRAIKPPVALPVSYRWVLYATAALLIIIALTFFLIKKVFIRKEKIIPPPPPRPAHEIAYEQLNRIKDDNLPARGLIKEYYTRISDTARHYLENRFGLRAPERTTEEFLNDMASTDYLSIRQQDLVGDFLAECDQVKFARYGPTEKQIEDVYEAAIRLVDETKIFSEKNINGV
ncbi:MAG: BatD family protein [Candidatus Euphemobacter frigidus]|nr:BatD family protein [Candidatus Euphemobacter frigidus]MDP8276335.1 BatD family protein [Candidatus Euphemobacter frigidus]